MQHIQDAAALQRSLYSLGGAIYANTAAMQSLDQDQSLTAFAQAIDHEAMLLDYRHKRSTWRPAGLSGRWSGNELMLGLSHRLNADWHIAAALNYGERRWTEDFQAPQQDSSRGHSYGLMQGLRQALPTGAYLKYLGGVAIYDNRVQRNVWLGDAPEAVGATARGQNWQAGLALGKSWQFASGFSLTPETGLLINHQRQNGLQEGGAMGYGLRAQAVRVTILSAYAQLKATHDLQLGGTALRLAALGGVRQDLRTRDSRADGGFSGLALENARSTQWNMGRTHWNASLGINAQMGSGLSVGLNYQADWSRGWADHSFFAALRYIH
ncbi:autotransporter outer membrane beta-barrel domain-containing protein [Bordetella avium]|uniref:autotransporter outer membrane beta-barrel domain-containing protein n=1 Tax=Bordetella avium TaxID=521 RepID=UPI000E68D300|nr:autotransporter outer membrane beta-barrel domain-containing protein [Bordetella avium]RIQ18134.1 autotransporter outer membrane beta-barrel domain-containing protein [Bordetella avium]